MSEEIIIPRWAILGIVGVGLIVVGWWGSPTDPTSGRPLILSPALRAMEDYRRQALGWDKRLHSFDQDLSSLLVSDPTDLYGQSQAAENLQNNTDSLLQEIDVHESPAALADLRQQFLVSATSYQNAAQKVLTWVSAPDETNRDQAEASLETARKTRNDLEQNPWLKPSP